MSIIAQRARILTAVLVAVAMAGSLSACYSRNEVGLPEDAYVDGDPTTGITPGPTIVTPDPSIAMSVDAPVTL